MFKKRLLKDHFNAVDFTEFHSHKIHGGFVVEGDFDPSHVRFLHSTLDVAGSDPGRFIMGNNGGRRRKRAAKDRSNFDFSQETVYEETPFGMTAVSVFPGYDGQQGVGVDHFYFPSFTSVGLAGPGVYCTNMRIPIDDESCYLYRLRWSYEPFTPSQIYEDRSGGYVYPDQIPGTFVVVANKGNDYLIDRVLQKNFNYTGIISFPIQDNALIEDQRGPIQDRSLEHLVSADEHIITLRRRLLQSARDLMEGQEPEGPTDPASFRAHEVNISVPGDMPIEEAANLVKEHLVGPPVRV